MRRAGLLVVAGREVSKVVTPEKNVVLFSGSCGVHIPCSFPPPMPFV